MKDQEFLMWLHERLEHVHREPAQADYMHKLRAIIEATPEDKAKETHMDEQTPATEAANGQSVLTGGLGLHYDTRCEIERLAAEAHDKKMRFQALAMMNTPQDYEERKKAAIEYALAQREMVEACRALENAINA